jgi:hypothetical protein
MGLNKPRLRRYMKCIVLILCASCSLDAFSLKERVDQSDAVVIGTAGTRVQGDLNVSFDLAVERVLKGTVSPQEIIHVSHAWQPGIVISNGPEQLISIPIRGLWFLRRAPTGWDILADESANGPASLFLPVSATPIASQNASSSNTSPIDSAVSEIAASVGSSRGRAEQLISNLGSLNTPTVVGVLTDFSKSQNPAVRSEGLAGLLSRNQPGSLSLLTQLWPSIKDDPAAEDVVFALKYSFRDTSSKSVVELVNIAESPSTVAQVREAAITALAAVHTKEALLFLASLLSSDDPDERMKGVWGLSSFANGCPPQTPDNVASGDYLHFKYASEYRTKETIDHFAFRRGPKKEEDDAVAYWLNWWNINKLTL